MDAPPESALAEEPAQQSPGDGYAQPEERDEYAHETWWQTVLHAWRGTGGDPTKGPINRAIFLLAVPMVLEMVMESVFALVDIFFVSRLGDDAIAGVAITESLMTIIYTVAMGLSIGVTAIVARRTGEDDQDGAATTTVQAVMLGGAVAVIFGVIGVVWAGDLLSVMGAEQGTIAIATPYTRIMFGTNAVIVLLFLQNAAFRGAGDAAIAMRMLWLANGINIVLDPLLIFGVGPFPELGVAGAAVATSIGRGTAVAVQLYALFRFGGRLSIAVAHVKVLPVVMARIVRLSATATFQTFIGMASWIGLVRLTAEFGSEALAGYAIAIRVILFGILPAWGLSNAAATMVGQGLGAGDPDRAERSVWIAAKMNFYFLGALGVAFMIFAPVIVGAFGGTVEASAYAVSCLRIVSAGFFFYAYGMVMTAAFNGAGAVWTPTIINLFCFWLFELPVGWLLAFPLGMGPTGIFISMMVAFSSLAVVSGLVFRRGTWKKAVV